MTLTAFLTCPICGEAFAPKVASQKYCGAGCAGEAESARAKERRNTPGEYSAAGVENLLKAIGGNPPPRAKKQKNDGETGYFPPQDFTKTTCRECGSQRPRQTRCKCGGWCA